MGGGLVADDFRTGPSEVKSTHERTILGETKFLSKARGRFITKECKLHKSELPNGLTINVIDTPGLFSASSTTEFTSREIIRCLCLARDGIDAVLLVFSVRNRLTEEEQSTLHTLKILLGRQIVDHIIVVFTNGDALDAGDTLEDYLQDCPEFREILKECDERKVLFDNRSDIPESKKEKQVQDLLNLVQQISNKNNERSYMADLSLELRENEAAFQDQQKQIEAMKSLSFKNETTLLKELEKSYKEMLKGMEEKAEAKREEAERKMKDIQNQSGDEIRKLREQLDEAMAETASLRAKLDSKKCTIL
ncbi:unnamed protein product [Microthlaspi erraticum]|uniref:AIG1-type G domain-containing protein n=1 Tax=Microthlaspi erraticum TaxID=1685480 RepID=A0A6D2IS24_9BRAS|nr:unnamed protein product [Microthlaspi erraticum]